METGKGWYAVRTKLEQTLDSIFHLDAKDQTHFDSLITLDDINKLGYVRNFPHLSCLLCDVAEADREELNKDDSIIDASYSPSNTRFVLLPAACYKTYLSLQNQKLKGPVVTGCIASCFRNEDKPLDDFRDINFTMKEYVCVGSIEDAKSHIELGAKRISTLFDQLNIPFKIETASDPFFDTASSTAVMSKIFPTKREFVFDSHAVASVNFHRNYFGTKFNISLDGEAANTSCVAFGVERWISMFISFFNTPETAMKKLENIKLDTALPKTSIRSKNEYRLETN